MSDMTVYTDFTIYNLVDPCPECGTMKPLKFAGVDYDPKKNIITAIQWRCETCEAELIQVIKNHSEVDHA